jgi:hypothetical protein
MGKLLLTGTAGTAGRPCALCAAAVVAFTVAAVTAGCAEHFDYVKPSATTAMAGHTSETAPQQAAQAPGADSGAPAAHE